MQRYRPVPVGLYRINSAVSAASDVVGLGLVPSSRLRTRYDTWRHGRRLVSEAINEYHPALIHMHFLRYASVAVRVANRHGVPTVLTVHGFDVTRWPDAGTLPKPARIVLGPLRRRAARRVLHRVDRVIAVSDMLRERVIALGADPKRTTTIPIGVMPTTEKFAPAAERRGVLFVGRLVEVKGVSDLIDAWSTLPADTRQTHHLIIVGDGPLRHKLEVHAKETGVDVAFLGSRTPQEVSRLMANAALFCGPSRTASTGDTEAFGIVFLEAATHELPVVAYRHGGVPEAVDDGTTGLLADEGDIAMLSRYLLKLLRDERLREMMGRAGRLRAETEFDLRVCSSMLEDVYDEVADVNRA